MIYRLLPVCFLSACSTFGVPKEVFVPVPVPCVQEIPRPQNPFKGDDELLAMDRYKRTLALWDERRERQIYEKTLLALLEACKWQPR